MLLTIIVFLLILSVLVLVHELGHFLIAKILGIKVEEFGFGLPPRLWGVKRGETVYSLNALPIGGFVKLLGEDQEPSSKSKVLSSKLRNRAFFARPVWQRSLVLVAGVSMNFLLALTVLSFLFTQGVMMPTARVHIEEVAPKSPAEKAGIKPQDIVVSLNHLPVADTKKFIAEVNRNLGKEVILEVERGRILIHRGEEKAADCGGCEKLTLHVVPRLNPPVKEVIREELTPLHKFTNQIKVWFGLPVARPKETVVKEGPLGVVVSSYETRVYSWREAPLHSLSESLVLSRELVGGVISTFWKLISLQPVGRDVSGPIGIAEMTGQAVKFGWPAVLELLGLLSLNLAIVNILPFPALDGGRLFFVLVEAATKKKIRPSWERNIHQIGMIILLALILLITLNDIVKMFTG